MFSTALDEVRIDIKYILSVIFICGWLLPKIKLGQFNLGIQEFAAILIVLYRYKVNKRVLHFFFADLFFSFFLLMYGFFHFLKGGDIEGILIGFRTVLFVMAAISFSSFDLKNLNKLIEVTIFINLVFVVWSVGRILINIFYNSFDALNFFYGSDSYRVRAPFENGGASSQVPIGYMIALLMCIPYVLNSKARIIVFILGAIGTTSRASILSVVIINLKKLNFRKIAGIVSVFILGILLYAVYLKSFTANNGELDGSANKRLELYASSLELMLKEPSSLLWGFGVSTSSLATATGEGFYESFIINSLMQGGVILFLFSIWILVKTFYYEFKYNLYFISVAVFLGNAVGGSNYFSMFAYPLMALIVCLGLKSSIKFCSEESSTFINIQ